jgi:hypothetical protein
MSQRICPGQLLTTNNPDGIAVMRYNVFDDNNSTDPFLKLIKLAEQDDIDILRRIPVGEFFLCLEVVWSSFNEEEDLCLNATIVVLWRENTYLLFCNAVDIQTV